MTEEDTIRKLKKLSFEEMAIVFQRIALTFKDLPSYPMRSDDWVRERSWAAYDAGWTVKEYQAENYRRFHLDKP